jgi:hypothetical protein
VVYNIIYWWDIILPPAPIPKPGWTVRIRSTVSDAMRLSTLHIHCRLKIHPSRPDDAHWIEQGIHSMRPSSRVTTGLPRSAGNGCDSSAESQDLRRLLLLVPNT